MGNSKSKIKRTGKTNSKSGKSARFESISKSSDNSIEEFANDPQLSLLRQTIRRNPELFILNNLMMCVQFFGNYEEEIKDLKKTLKSSREMKMNEQLNKQSQKRVLVPDILQEHITRHVGFISRRQDIRSTIEPLQPVRIYMVHDNIDITEENYSSHYSNVNDSITYNILLKPTKHEGYVQLQVLDDLNDFLLKKKSIKEDEMDLSSILEDDDELYSDASIYGSKARSNLSVSSNRSAISNRSKQDMLRSRLKHTRSLPNLTEDLSHTDIMDYDGGSSPLEERGNQNRSKMGGNQRWQKDTQQSKFQVNHPSSNSSGYRSDNYAIYSESNPSQSSRVSQASSSFEEIDESWITNGRFPKRCFKKVTYTSDGKIYDPAEEKVNVLNSKQRRIKLAMKRHNYDLSYISSTEFMKHFIKLFAYKLGYSLCFDRETVEDLKREGCVLYCDKIMISDAYDKDSQIEQYEIIPAIWLKWPICGQEWLNRSRESWPSEKDIDKVKDFGCYVVPEGYVPKSGNSNLIEDLEWQLTFPTAERYLETCMTQAQVQVYLIALMLHKTFMRPIFDTMFGMTTAHIRHKLFWMIEENDKPSKWPENGTGECLLKLLNSLYYNISQNEPILRDYFIKGRNLFQRIPCEHLLHTQKQLKRITENPIMYVFHAMENIQYRNDFFPRLDFELLLRILTGETLTLINPTLNRYISKQLPQKYVNVVQEDKYDERGFWDTQRVKRSVKSIRSNRTLINARKATDSIIEISTRCAELEGPRLCILLKFFIKHFIEIAECCIQYEAYRQKTIYLNQADRLSILLFEGENYRNDAKTYREKIKSLRTMNSKSRNEPSTNPSNSSLRNSEKAIYVESLSDRFTSRPVRSTETKEKLSEKRSDQENSRTHVIKAIIHERQYEELDKLNDKSKSVTINENENQISKSKRNKPQSLPFLTSVKLNDTNI